MPQNDRRYFYVLNHDTNLTGQEKGSEGEYEENWPNGDCSRADKNWWKESTLLFWWFIYEQADWSGEKESEAYPFTSNVFVIIEWIECTSGLD